MEASVTIIWKQFLLPGLVFKVLQYASHTFPTPYHSPYPLPNLYPDSPFHEHFWYMRMPLLLLPCLRVLSSCPNHNHKLRYQLHSTSPLIPLYTPLRLLLFSLDFIYSSLVIPRTVCLMSVAHQWFYFSHWIELPEGKIFLFSLCCVSIWPSTRNKYEIIAYKDESSWSLSQYISAYSI